MEAGGNSSYTMPSLRKALLHTELYVDQGKPHLPDQKVALQEHSIGKKTFSFSILSKQKSPKIVKKT